MYLKVVLLDGMVLLLNINYSKCPNISNILFHTFWPNFAFMLLFLNILSGMTNSVDSDQTAPEGAV